MKPPPEPDDDTGLTWEEPPMRGTRIIEALTPRVEQLRANPGRWARLHSYPAPSSAQGAVSKLRKAFPDIEFKAGRIDGGSAVWGRATSD